MKKVSILLLFIILLLSNAYSQTVEISDHRTYLRQTSKLLNEGKKDEAITLLTKGIGAYPNESILYFRRAEVYRNLKKLDLMESDVYKAVSNSKDKYNDYVYASSLFMQVRKCENAVVITTKAINLAPTKTDAYYARATLQGYCFDNKAGALNDINYLLSLDPQNTLAKSFRNRLLAEIGNQKPTAETDIELIKALEQKLQNSPEDGKTRRELSSLYISRARLFEREKDTEQMFASFDRGIEIHPISQYLKMRGLKLAEHKYFEEAIKDLNDALKEQPEFWLLYIHIGDVYTQQNQFQKAIDTYEKALTIELASEKLINQKIKRTKLKMQNQNAQ